MARYSPLLTTAEVAELLNLAVDTVRDYRQDGKGPAYIKLSAGRSAPVRYRQVDVDRWLDSQRVTP